MRKQDDATWVWRHDKVTSQADRGARNLTFLQTVFTAVLYIGSRPVLPQQTDGFFVSHLVEIEVELADPMEMLRRMQTDHRAGLRRNVL